MPEYRKRNEQRSISGFDPRINPAYDRFCDSIVILIGHLIEIAAGPLHILILVH
jgi:hypothetical protein